jgi:hypothetical protein
MQPAVTNSGSVNLCKRTKAGRRSGIPGKNRNQQRRLLKMTKTMRALVVGAALSGFVAGTTAMASTTTAGDSGKKASKEKKDKHACKGQNSCKGKGGCGADKGKNDCKGKGGCRTDGKPMDKDKH